jgi:hypothetical protein
LFKHNRFILFKLYMQEDNIAWIHCFIHHEWHAHAFTLKQNIIKGEESSRLTSIYILETQKTHAISIILTF